MGIPALMQQDQQHLGSKGMQVRPSAHHRGLKSQHCCSCSIGHKCGSDLIPGLGIPLAAGWPQKKNNNDIHETPKIT